MSFENMFKPIQIGPMNVPNRFVVPPMGNNFANTDGSLSENLKITMLQEQKVDLVL